MGISVCYLGVLAVYWFGESRGAQSAGLNLKAWGLIGGALVILTVAVVFKVPIRLGFALIRPALERVLEGKGFRRSLRSRPVGRFPRRPPQAPTAPSPSTDSP